MGLDHLAAGAVVLRDQHVSAGVPQSDECVRPVLGIAEGPDHAVDSGSTQFDADTLWNGEMGDLFGKDRTDGIAEVVDIDDFTADAAVTMLGGFPQRHDDGVGHRRSQLGEGHTGSQVGAGWRKEIAAMECVCYVGQPVLGLVEIDEFRRPAQVIRPADACGENTVVRSDEVVRADPGGDGAPLGAHTGIDHDHMDGVVGEEEHTVVDNEAGFADVLRCDFVAQVRDDRIGCDAVYGSVEDGMAPLTCAEVRGEGYEGHGVIVDRYSHGPRVQKELRRMVSM